MRIETVQMALLSDEHEAPGMVRAVATAQIAARTMGTALEVRAREGDHVKRGQMLAQLDERELAARQGAAQAALREVQAGRDEVARAVSAAQAQADLAKKTHERFVYLRDQKSVSPQEFDEADARNRAAQAALAAAQARQQQADATYARAQSEARAAETVAGYARITAPFDGVVVRRQVEPGTLVAPGMPLFVVEDTSRYQMEVTVDASDVRMVQRGTKARVRVDSLPGSEMEGTIVELEAGADPGTQTVRAKIELPRDAALRSGLFGRAWFRRGERRVIAVPKASIVERGQLRGVYVVDTEQVARWRLITLGDAIGDRVEVLSGLSEGERYVAEPGSRELDGKKIAANAAKAEERP
jgi:RND family efflux transporter MFP subunit